MAPLNFKTAGFCLLANKAYSDYVFSLRRGESTEPEHFLDVWELENTFELSVGERKIFTKAFMKLLAKKGKK